MVVCDNGMYGTIRMHQEREFPGRVSATELHNPDFDAYARAFGGFGAVVRKTAEFPEAFAAARASGLPSIIHLKIDSDAILPRPPCSAFASARCGKGSPARRGSSAAIAAPSPGPTATFCRSQTAD